MCDIVWLSSATCPQQFKAGTQNTMVGLTVCEVQILAAKMASLMLYFSMFSSMRDPQLSNVVYIRFYTTEASSAIGQLPASVHVARAALATATLHASSS